ncbi:MAG: hypothetical protein OEW69_11335, partial [Nitrospirota bacterium]|nr:hypothetical protein [Nitrospirota bacterium]
MPIDLIFFKYIIQEGLKIPRIYNLTGSSPGLLLALYNKPFLVFEPTEERAEELHKDINFFRETLKRDPVLFLPESNGPSLSGQRAKTIYYLKKSDSLVSSFKNLHSPLWSRKELEKVILPIEHGTETHRAEIEKRLQGMGYERVSLVVEKGEYSQRGWILDVFPSTEDNPLRIEFFGDEIESIKTFDVDTQRSIDDISRSLIFPAKDPASGATLSELISHAKYFFSDLIQERDLIPSENIFLSKYSIKGDGYDAGLLSIKGLGIIPEERKYIDELPQKI